MKTYTITKDNKEIKVKEYDDGRIYHYDSKGNIIYHKYPSGLESWHEYDENDNLIHYKNSYGIEVWREYDENNNLIHYKDSKRYEEWNEYDENNNKIHYKNTDGNEYFYINNNNQPVSKEEWLNNNTNFQYKYIYDVILTLKEWNEDITIDNIKNNLHNIRIDNIKRKFNIIKNIFI